jgi:hypothetical protein
MNSNLVRTIAAIVTMSIGILTALGGCSTDAVSGAITCTAGYLNAGLLGLIVTALGFLHLISKVLSGMSLTKPAATTTGKVTIKENP